VEDLAQQVFIRVWKSARRYVPRAKFTTWLLKITRNLVFNELRRTKRHAHVPLQSEPGAEDPPLKDEINLAPDASLLELELQRTIEEAILQLPETQRLALVLRRYEQLSYEQIAEILDLSVPAVKSVLFRARPPRRPAHGLPSPTFPGTTAPRTRRTRVRTVNTSTCASHHRNNAHKIQLTMLIAMAPQHALQQ